MVRVSTPPHGQELEERCQFVKRHTRDGLPYVCEKVLATLCGKIRSGAKTQQHLVEDVSNGEFVRSHNIFAVERTGHGLESLCDSN
mmetsp:Transcript_92315/g.214505  ORF Transcript_92315/g.214505 Transcript_92315/m.214505 type:complete len:86 (+) Transcript_92315:91-348(+)